MFCWEVQVLFQTGKASTLHKPGTWHSFITPRLNLKWFIKYPDYLDRSHALLLTRRETDSKCLRNESGSTDQPGLRLWWRNALLTWKSHKKTNKKKKQRATSQAGWEKTSASVGCWNTGDTLTERKCTANKLPSKWCFAPAQCSLIYSENMLL